MLRYFLKYVQQPADPGQQKLLEAGFRKHGKVDSPASCAVPHMEFLKTIILCVCTRVCVMCRHAGTCGSQKSEETWSCR